MTDQITCGACSSICATCSLIASNCTKCVGAYLYNYNCVTKCPNNFYPDGNLSCQVCNSTVAACNIEPLQYVLKSYSKNG
jgi:proprotein convertase subtilisin/kexin type 5